MSTLRYANGETLGGSNMREGLEGASDQLVREGHPPITVVSGDRPYQTQVDIFLSRYVLAGQVNGRYVYDWRTWEGRIYGRISSAGTVAAPSRTAPHVAQIAADLGAPYNAYTAARARLVAIAPQYGIENTGTSFGEVWHWQTTRGVGSTASNTSTPFLTEMDREMIFLRRKSNNAAYAVIPGECIKHVPNANEERLLGYAAGAVFKDLSDADFSVLLWGLGFPHLGGDLNRLPLNGQYHWRPGR